MSMEEDLGKLICMMNPYTNGTTGSMDPHMFVNAGSAAAVSGGSTTPPPGGSPTPPPGGSTTPPPGGSPTPPPGGSTTGSSGGSTTASDMIDCWMEIDDKYPGSWGFKGQAQKINTALRIGYRWKKTVNGTSIWVTDYLLVGFEGSGGGE